MSNVIDQRADEVTVLVTQGDAWFLEATIWDDATKTNPTNLTGCTISAQLRSTIDSETAVALTATITDAVNGEFSVGQAVSTISGVWDVEVTFPSTQKRTYLGGCLKLSKSATRA